MSEEIKDIKKQKYKELFNSKPIEALIFFFVSMIFLNILGNGISSALFVSEIATYLLYCPKFKFNEKYDKYLSMIFKYVLPVGLVVAFLLTATYDIKMLLISILLIGLLYLNFSKMGTIWEWIISLFVPFYLIMFMEYLNDNFKSAFELTFNPKWQMITGKDLQIHIVYLFSFLIIWSLICLFGLFIKKRKVVYSLMGYLVFVFGLLNKLSLLCIGKALTLTEFQPLLTAIVKNGSNTFTENLGIWIVSLILIILYESIISGLMKGEYILTKATRVVLAVLGTCIILGTLYYMKSFNFNSFTINSTLFNIIKSIY